jgi:2-polyprenyl-3-methyl-5-hydroxy-6-metoxy-1,4-benzoquinol methylase
MEIQLRIAELRKLKGATQLELAEYLGVSFQSVSKWENGVSLPDITHLPRIAEFFSVSVDYILGMENKFESNYSSRSTHKSSHWDKKIEYLKNTREGFWNDDYLKFLVECVWKLDEPCNVVDFGCGFGYLGMKLLPLLPDGSRYTGIDISQRLIDEAKKLFSDSSYKMQFQIADVSEFKEYEQYDIAICQALLRHLPNPKAVLKNMISSVRTGGLVICIETNRPFESVGTMINGLPYNPSNEIAAYSKLWSSELNNEGRDFSIGLKLPIMMRALGLLNVDVRLNDKISFLDYTQDHFKDQLEIFESSKGWSKSDTHTEKEHVEFLKNRGLNDDDVELFNYVRNREKDYIQNNREELSMVQMNGTIISFGTK